MEYFSAILLAKSVAPQLDISKRIIAVLVPKHCRRRRNPTGSLRLAKLLCTIQKSSLTQFQDAALVKEKVVWSVDRNVPGYVVRHARVTVDYFDKGWRKTPYQAKRLQPSLFSMKLTHINGIMFYDRINEKDPFASKDGLLILE